MTGGRQSSVNKIMVMLGGCTAKPLIALQGV